MENQITEKLQEIKTVTGVNKGYYVVLYDSQLKPYKKIQLGDLIEDVKRSLVKELKLK